ncbi:MULTISPECIES: dihydrolipoamide acetyltransferase family protein [Brevibacterium]|uniref:Dihydrolipoamide acetyltransferase component of pyruvate dehydrogenase complex n=1 Tax=Brevibacterium salitolerans TaxID=1403566 RepID=A0ABN2WMU7_9MICO|nr:dihydrolipoamide acetyltransferase family protein [Brevibacterium sp.]
MNTFSYHLPDVGEGLDEAEIISWKVSVGTKVVPDQVLAEVETDKSVVEVPSPVAGTVTALAGEPGDMVEVGAVFVEIALAEAGDGDSPAAGAPLAPAADGHLAGQEAPPSQKAPAATSTGVSAASDPAAASAESAAGRRRVLASPATRRAALDLGVDLREVPGSGPGGRVTKDDVLAAAQVGSVAAAAVEAGLPAEGAATSEDTAATTGTASGVLPSAASAAAAPTKGASAAAGRFRADAPVLPSAAGPRREDEIAPLRGLRRQIAKNMTESWQQVPHITDFREIDASGLVAARRAVNAHLAESGRGGKITYLPFLVRAVSIALAHNPTFNAALDMEKEQITYYGHRSIGLAVSTEAGLFVPVLKNSQALSLVGISQAAQSLAERARARTITSEEMSGGTFTITNFGSYGGWLGTPIIRPPEAAIAGFGRIADRVVAEDGAPVVRPILPLAVSADHRLIDGADMGVFLEQLTALLEDPVRMLAEEF